MIEELETEHEEYKQLLKSYPEISFFVIDGELPHKVGSARYV